ncbi:MAG: hypothetical protein NT069_05250, partial [Planctomycetota bacterium]|nr:hypothetical protein [Planctomycetota bacterium]
MNSPHDPQQSESDSSTPAVEPKPKRSRFAALESLLDAAASGAVVSEPAVPAPPPPAAPPPAEPPPTVAPRKFAMGVEMQVVSRLPSESKPATPSIVTEQPILESASRPGSLAAVLAAVVDDADQPVPTTHRGSDSGVPESPAALPQQPPPVIRNEEPSPSASRGLPGERVVVDGGPAAARQEPRPPV